MRRLLAATVAVGALVAVLAAANARREPGGVRIDWRIVKPMPREVAIERPTRALIVQTVVAPATAEPVEEADIASQIVGRVVAVPVKDGDHVSRGDVLVRLDDTDLKARLDSSQARIDKFQAAIRQAEAELEKLSRDVARFTLLAGRNASSPTELADARSALVKARAALAMNRHERDEGEAMLRMSRQELDRTVIRSPIDGVVAGLEVEVGEVVIAGTTNLPGTVLMTVGDLSRMRARADVDETDVPLVRSGQVARVFLQADPTRPIAGTVDRVAPKGTKNGEVVSFETLVRVDATDAALRPGMTATVEIEVRRAEGALGVPVQAVVHRRRKDLPDSPAVRAWAARHARTPGERARDAETRYVKIAFVADGGVARARPVETGLSDEQHIEIRSGLDAEDRVIVGPFRALDELKDGDPIAPASP